MLAAPAFFRAILDRKTRCDAIVCVDYRGIGIAAIAAGRLLHKPVIVQGETALSTFHVMNAAAGATGMVGDFRLQQAVVQYTWDDESATGMLERSSASNRVD